MTSRLSVRVASVVANLATPSGPMHLEFSRFLARQSPVQDCVRVLNLVGYCRTIFCFQAAAER